LYTVEQKTLLNELSTIFGKWKGQQVLSSDENYGCPLLQSGAATDIFEVTGACGQDCLTDHTNINLARIVIIF